MSISGNEFILSYFFKDVSSMKADEYRFSPWVEKFGVLWRLETDRTDNHIGVAFHCRLPEQMNKKLYFFD
ncbi:hypothetical protein CAEBREN_25543 [Caenorhabditis brenneri]|uniref:MATH domain-containing protein n=1 Tax=Caenorhabditis brenneri TaxID=135651 RepID=G0P516_CAEBE|nr:hypothetical protein CAEBREN_25543 [Caenorhabditis brenneri]